MLFVLIATASCGGGGGGGGGTSGPAFVSLVPGTLNLSAVTPSSTAPAPQTVTATITGVTSGTLVVRILIDGLVVTTVGTVTVNPSAQTGSAPISFGTPANLGPGPHTATVTVIACLNDVNCAGPQIPGSPKTINVNYTVGSSVQTDAVAPYLGTSGVTGDVVLRSQQGLDSATSVVFGATPATAITKVNDTELHATYPLLTAGPPYAVQVLGKSGPAFTGSLTIVDSPAYTSTALAYPAPPQDVLAFVYDAERKALLVGVSDANTANNQILRYAFASGNWVTPPASVTLAGLRHFALSLDGSRLLAVADPSAVADGFLAEVDPVALTTSKSTTKPSNVSAGANEFMQYVAVANDGNAVVTTSYKNGSGPTRLYLYSIQSGFSTPAFAGQFPTTFLSSAMATSTGDGTSVTIAQSGVTPDTPFYRYVASTGVLGSTGHSLQHRNIPPAFDRTGSRMVTTSIVGTFTVTFDAYDGNFAHLGALPSTTNAYTVRPDGSRAYTFENNGGTCQVRALELTTATDPLTETGAPFPLTVPCAGDALPPNVKMIVNPAGDTLFLAGKTQIVVVALPL